MEPEQIEEALDDAAVIDHLRQANRRLGLQLTKAQISKEEMMRAAREAAHDAALMFTIPPTPKPVRDQRKKGEEVAIAVLSDWQLGKTTPTYNSDVCAQRMDLYGDKLIEITNIQRADHPVKELHVDLLGDLPEAEQIFPGQAYRIDSSVFMQVLVNGPEILVAFLQKMLGVGEFERVHVEGVYGNHGRVGRRGDYHPETNWDAILYEHVRQLLRNEQRLTWGPNFTPGERKWYAIDKIGDQAFMLFHGDQVRGGFAGMPWYGVAKKVQGWRNGAIPEAFNGAFMGHYHTPCRIFLNTITVWANGSTESSNTYANEELAAAGQPCQWLLFCHPQSGISAEYLVHLD